MSPEYGATAPAPVVAREEDAGEPELLAGRAPHGLGVWGDATGEFRRAFVARCLRSSACMIGKTTAAEGAATQTIRRAISSNSKGQGFAVALQQQSERVEAAKTAGAASVTAEPAGRVAVGHRAEVPDGAAAAARTPVGNRGAAASTDRSPVTPERSGPETPTTAPDGSRPNLSTADVVVNTTGAISEDERTEGMYVPPDFYHGTSYSPVFDRVDENGNMVRTPRFEGQVIYSDWRGSLPEDFDPNARVLRDPLAFENSPAFWKKNEDGTWSRRETGYGGIPLYDNGKPVYTPDPLLYPEYFKV